MRNFTKQFLQGTTMVRRAVLNERKRMEAQMKANQPKKEKRPETPRGKYF